jgi:hypothetical protein
VTRRNSSIASAPGWKARFLAEDELGGTKTVTLVSWALVEADDGATEIVGVVQRASTPAAPHGSLGFADEVDGFEGYTFTGLAVQSGD